MTTLANNLGKNTQANTAKSDGKVSVAPAAVFYDDNCQICRELAHFMSKQVDISVMIFLPSEDPKPESICVHYSSPDGSMIQLQNQEAWEWLVANHPTLKPLQWLAAKLNLTKPAASWIARSATTLRRLCPKCTPKRLA